MRVNSVISLNVDIAEYVQIVYHLRIGYISYK